MKLRVRTLLVMGMTAACLIGSAGNAEAGLFSKLFKCKSKEESTCCPEPEPCCPEPEPCCPEPEPVCCPEPAPEPVCCPEPAPEPVCCPAPAPEPVCCPEPTPEPVCCEPVPEPAPAPCCGSAMLQGYPSPELAEGEVLVSIDPISLPSEPATQVARIVSSEIIRVAAK